MSIPAISIIMPVYNAEATLGQALDSILSQTRTDWELIVVDDGSIDASRALIETQARIDPRIRLIAGAHRGIVAALQAGSTAARGALLARMDADDIALPKRIALQSALFDTERDLALCGTRVRMTGAELGTGRKRYERWINSLLTHEDMARELFVECPLAHPTFMMRRDFFERIGGYRDLGWPEDYDLALRFWCAGGRLGKTEETLLEWRHRPDRLSMTDARYGEKAFRALKRHFLSHAFLDEYERPFHQWGAGEVGKKWLREWPRPPRAVVDINPRKIGRLIHGVPVIAPDALPPPGESPILVAVGAPGARDEIRSWFHPRGYREQTDYLFIA